ncbi:hypothetical protein M8J76_015880 [Diaphorina citri]|nr:hypothetical protein M8J76_015880 [Diaphorina citri]
MKTVFDLERIVTDIEQIKVIRMKNGNTKLGVDMGDGQYSEATGLIFINATKEPWIRSISRSHNKKYFNNPITRVSKFEMDPDACASFVDCMNSRRIWKWEMGSGMKGDEPSRDTPVLHKHQLCSIVYEKTQPQDSKRK